MNDPVNAADVLADCVGYDERVPHMVDALLVCGGGDPVVIMPDGTLRRAVRIPGTRADFWHVAPVQP